MRDLSSDLIPGCYRGRFTKATDWSKTECTDDKRSSIKGGLVIAPNTDERIIFRVHPIQVLLGSNT